MMNRFFCGLPLFLILTGCGGTGESDKSAGEEKLTFDVSDPLRQKLSKAQRQYQTAMYQILVSEAPALKDVLETSRDLQIAMTHRADMQYEHLWKNDASRVTTVANCSAWMNFDWRENDETELMAASSRYSDLQERVTVLEQKNQGHAMWPEARELFQRMQKDVQMTNLHKQLQTSIDEIDDALKGR